MKINTKLQDGKWVDFNEKVKFKIRAFPIDNLMLVGDDFQNNIKAGQLICDYCVCDWKGIEDEDGNEYKYSNENKKYLLNYYVEFYEFISGEVEKLKNVEPHIVKKTSKK
jgi:hypothetical protein